MQAERKSVESDLLVDVFFSNIIAGRDGITPEIGANGHWWMDGRDTSVLARGIDGTNGKSPYIGANGNWWLDGKDLGVKAKAPAVSIGGNGHWIIDGVDTAVPSNIGSFLSKTTTEAQAVAGDVTFNGNLLMTGTTDIRNPAYVASNPQAPVPKDDFEIVTIPVDAPHIVFALARDAHRRVKVVLEKAPALGDIYIVFSNDTQGFVVDSSDEAVNFHWAGETHEWFEARNRRIVILFGYTGAWYAYTINDNNG